MTPGGKPIAIATEDALSEAIALRLVAEVASPDWITHTLRRGGFGYLRSRMSSWRAMAEQQIMLVLTDLDQAACPVALRSEWAGPKPLPAPLLLRIAVREVEAWALADHEAMRALLGARAGALPPQPDDLPDPKQALLKLSKRAPKALRDDLLRVEEGGRLLQGLGYNARLIVWTRTQWSPQRAAERSPSLARTRQRLREAFAAAA